MSLVIAIGNKDFVMIVGEKRATDITGKINENYKKVYKLKKNVILGYAGAGEYCEAIVKPLIENINKDDNVTLSQITTFVNLRTQGVVNLINESNDLRNAKFFIAAAGKSENDELELHSFSYTIGYTYQKYKLNDINPILLVLSNDEYDHYSYCENLFKKSPFMQEDNIKRILFQTIENGAKYDSSINNNIDIEIIRK